LAAVCSVVLLQQAQAQQSWPNRQITLIVPFGSGSLADIIGRNYATKLQKYISQPIIVDNRTGAGTVIGTRAAAAAAPDGYTFVLTGATSMASGTVLDRNLGYKPEDFASVAVVGTSPLIFTINADVPAKSVGDFVKLAKENPNKYIFSSSG